MRAVQLVVAMCSQGLQETPVHWEMLRREIRPWLRTGHLDPSPVEPPLKLHTSKWSVSDDSVLEASKDTRPFVLVYTSPDRQAWHEQ